MKLRITKLCSSTTFFYLLSSALLSTPFTLFAQTPSEEDYRKEYEANSGLAAINADVAYKMGITGKDVMIGIVDYGIDPKHPEFETRSASFTPIVIYAGGQRFDGGVLNKPGSNGYTHGMHVGGTIAAAKNGVGMHGVAYDSDIFSAKSPLSSSYASVFSREMNALYNNGVRAINHSWGLKEWKDAINNLIQDSQKVFSDAVLAAISASAKKEVIQVSALGNDFLGKNNNPGNYASLYPYFDPSVKDYWISVANVDQDHKIYEESNHCSISADWCLAAPGSDIYSSIVKENISSPEESPYSYESWYGTSMAAPHVTGALALAMQRFPYMDNKQIREVILTTTNNSGHLSNTAIYGQGLLDVGKAMHGPGKFRQDWDLAIDDDACADLTDQTCNVWSNDISGPGGLNKTGSGILTLSGKNSYRGITDIAEGELHIAGELNGSDITISDGLLNINASGKVTNTTTLIKDGQLLAAGNMRSTDMRVENGLLNVDSTGLVNTNNTVLKGGKIDMAGAFLSDQLRVQGGSLSIQINGKVNSSKTYIEGGKLYVAGELNGSDITLSGGLLNINASGKVTNTTTLIKDGQLLAAGNLRSADMRMENGLLNVASTGLVNTNNTIIKGGKIDMAGVLLSDQLHVQGGLFNVQTSGKINSGKTYIEDGKLDVAGELNGSDITLSGGLLNINASGKVTNTTTLIKNGQLFAAGNLRSADMRIENGLLNIIGKLNIDGMTQMLNGLLYLSPEGVINNNGMVMQGGQLTVDGQLNNQKDTQVEGGKLTVNGHLNSTELVIKTAAEGAPATLRGTGFIHSPTTIAGILAPGNSAGTLTFSAPLTMTAGSQTQLDIDGIGTASGAGHYSRVVGQNTVTLGGRLLPRLRGIEGQATNVFTPAVGNRFAAALSAQGGFVGGFDALVQPDGLVAGSRFDVLFQGNQADLAVASSTLPGSLLGDNAAAGAQVLNALRDTPMALRPGAYNTWLGQATVGGAGDVTYRAIGGQIYADSLAWGMAYQDGLGQVLFDRLAGFGSGKTAYTPGYALWMEVPYRRHTYSASPSRLDTQAGFGGVLLGLDRQFEGLQVGAAFGVVDGRVKQDVARVDLDGYSFSVYGRYGFADGQPTQYLDASPTDGSAQGSTPGSGSRTGVADAHAAGSGAYVVGRLSYVALNARSQRSLSAMTTTLNGGGQYHHASAELGIGSTWSVQQWQVNPELRLQHTHSQGDGVEESGVNPNDPFALTVDGLHRQRTGVRAQLRTSRRITLDQGYLTPQVMVGVQRRLGATPTSTARLSNLAAMYGNAGPWSIQQSAAVDERTLFSLGLGVQWQQRLWSAKAHVNATTSSLRQPFNADSKSLGAGLQVVRWW